MRLIDADALRAAMYHEAMEKDSNDQRWDSGCWIRYRMFERVVDSMPSIEERKNGHWIIHIIEYRLGRFNECSECGYLTPEYVCYKGYHAWNFCPRCGAFMRGSDN